MTDGASASLFATFGLQSWSMITKYFTPIIYAYGICTYNRLGGIDFSSSMRVKFCSWNMTTTVTDVQQP